eukprot:CAMPEP_0174927238 /NCGR_PEP_ID=MMETSP1355-20121228/18026_1 /TAXON_ID=464990 /ORGANISM="Hemiselmis tepida, Strain CCMP443" /LENGTH=252 /DNA_ID=CAMNT_0016173327 /DNA_START=209 /DNA_END=967 /DNA_ORIENTATION=+
MAPSVDVRVVVAVAGHHLADLDVVVPPPPHPGLVRVAAAGYVVPVGLEVNSHQANALVHLTPLLLAHLDNVDDVDRPLGAHHPLHPGHPGCAAPARIAILPPGAPPAPGASHPEGAPRARGAGEPVGPHDADGSLDTLGPRVSRLPAEPPGARPALIALRPLVPLGTAVPLCTGRPLVAGLALLALRARGAWPTALLERLRVDDDGQALVCEPVQLLHDVAHLGDGRGLLGLDVVHRVHERLWVHAVRVHEV